MSVPNGDAENPGRAHSAHEVEAASAVPKGLRAVTTWRRRAVLWRPPLAPIPPMFGSELAQDAVLKGVLTAADPQPLPVQPLRDPVGLALGVVARLIVAGCAAAAVAMLLVGTMPAPFRPGPARPPVQPVAALPAAKGAPAANNTQRTASAPPPTSVATLSVRSARADAASRSALDPDDIGRLVKRGEDLLAHGDIAAARLLLARAAEAHDAQATLSLAASYDPEVLHRLPVLGIKPDVAAARVWYEKAAGYGSAEAIRRLATLPEHDP